MWKGPVACCTDWCEKENFRSVIVNSDKAYCSLHPTVWGFQDSWRFPFSPLHATVWGCQILVIKFLWCWGPLKPWDVIFNWLLWLWRMDQDKTTNYLGSAQNHRALAASVSIPATHMNWCSCKQTCTPWKGKMTCFTDCCMLVAWRLTKLWRTTTCIVISTTCLFYA